VRQQNLPLIGETADLHEILFGSERNNLVPDPDRPSSRLWPSPRYWSIPTT